MFEVLDNTRGHTVSIKVFGKTEKQDYDKIIPVLLKTIRDFEKANLYIEFDYLNAITPNTIWEDFKAFIKSIGKINKIAIVSNNYIFKDLVNESKPLLGIELRYYSYIDKKSAQNWIK